MSDQPIISDLEATQNHANALAARIQELIKERDAANADRDRWQRVFNASEKENTRLRVDGQRMKDERDVARAELETANAKWAELSDDGSPGLISRYAQLRDERDHLLTVRDMLEQERDALREQVRQGAWIKCSERMPENNCAVIVLCQDADEEGDWIGSAFHLKNDGWQSQDSVMLDTPLAFTPTHWMPLPSPPAQPTPAVDPTHQHAPHCPKLYGSYCDCDAVPIKPADAAKGTTP